MKFNPIQTLGRIVGALACTVATLSAPGFALQGGTGCQLDWLPTFGSLPPDATILALASLDTGSGTELYVGGYFSDLHVPGGDDLVRWNGTSWSDVGGGLDGQVSALTAGDLGYGPVLFVAGNFTHAGGTPISGIAQWNGTSWSALGTNVSRPEAMRIHDDGTGPALYVGGGFSSMGGVPANSVAKWNGTSWSALGSGLNSSVLALTVFDDGSGPALVAGGGFTATGTTPLARVAKWNGTSWSTIGTTLTSGSVYSLVSYDSGTGPKLYAAGTIDQRVRVWSGTNWVLVGNADFDAFVSELAVFDDGVQSSLVACGVFTHIGLLSIAKLARWNGTQWSPLDTGVSGGNVEAMAPCDLGSGPRLFVGGNFTTAGNVAAHRFAAWDGATWTSPAVSGLSGRVQALEVFDDGAGEALYAGGQFATVDDVVAHFIARWNGSTWSALSSGLNSPVESLCVHDDGSGPALYAGGNFTQAGGVLVNHVARWNGNAWSGVGAGISGNVIELASFDDGSGARLYASAIPSFGGGVLAWNGTSWSSLGLAGGTIRALMGFDDGSGPKLYAAGSCTPPGFSTGEYVIRWDGTNWQVVGAMNLLIECLGAYDDGQGPGLYAGGEFLLVNGAPITRIAKWNGSTWSGLGSGLESISVRALTVYDDEQGPALHVGGYFLTAGGQPAAHIARWNGTSWSPLGGGLPFWSADLAVFDAGGCLGPALYAGGAFVDASSGDSYLARWGCTSATASSPCAAGPYCFGDGLDPAVTTPCPCGNYGAPGHGCANSVQPGGALLTAFGALLPDHVVLTGSNMPASVACIYLQGDVLGDTTFGDGVRCATGTLLRLRTRTNVGGTSRFPDSTDMITLSQRGGVVPGSGAVRYYHTYYRNASSSFCPPETFNVTNGWRITW